MNRDMNPVNPILLTNRFRRRALVTRLAIACILLILLSASAFGQPNVLTYRGDNSRAGQNTQETILKPDNVNPLQFGKVFTYLVDGYVYAQPLYVANVTIPNLGTHNVVYIATEHDSVYAFDADGDGTTSPQPLWKTSFLNSRLHVTPVPFQDTRTDDITPEVGITGTPVIDPVAGTLFVVAKTKEGGRRYAQRLHALNITTGKEQPGSPVAISATVRDAKGRYALFNPLIENQRAGLTLLNGVVYIAWASHGDNGNYHGFVLGYDARTYKQVARFATTISGKKGGIWQDGCGLSADDSGHLYCTVGNGDFDVNTGGQNYGNCVIEFATTGGLAVASYFAPFDEAARNFYDLDLGSAGPVLIHNLDGAYTDLVVTGDKGGNLFVLDPHNLGGFRSTDNNQIAQYLPNFISSFFSTPAYWNRQLYTSGAGDVPRAFAFTGDGAALPEVSEAPPLGYGWPGAVPAISANGNDDGILWTIDTTGFHNGTPAILYAYDALDLSDELYNSSMNGDVDAAAPAVKFTSPMIVNGKVYVGGVGAVTVYGLH